MYVADLLFISEYFIDGIGNVNRFIDAAELVPESCFDFRKERLSALPINRDLVGLIPCRYRKESCHVAVRVVQITTHRTPGRCVSRQNEEKRPKNVNAN